MLDLVVGILSPATASKDTVRKHWAYEVAGVPEYLIVDPQEQVAELLRLEIGLYLSAARLEWSAVAELPGGAIAGGGG
ncbi:MAG: Uma2 family endonuclease [Holophaga sp.]|nr:Uma2 family endonuclease [Holophaga sp.]